MQQSPGLFLQGLDNFRMAVPEVVDCDSSQEVQVGSAIHIPQTTPFTTFCDDRVTTVSFHDGVFRFIDPFL